MKTTALLTIGLVLAAPCLAGAQDDGPAPPFQPPVLGEDFDPGRPDWHPPPDQPPPGRFGGKKGPRAHLDRWLNRLREENPAEFERMQRLREESPREFRRELKQKVRREQIRAKLKTIPVVYDFLMTLPADEREDILDQFAELAGPQGPRRHEDRTGARIRSMERETRNLSARYRAATEEEKPAIRAALKAQLETLFDAREAAHDRGIAAMEKKLEKLKTRVQTRRAHREEIIERRLDELTEGDPLAW